MNTEQIAVLILGLYTLLGIAVVLTDAWNSSSGWRAWILYVVARLYCGLFFRWRSSGSCPFPGDSGALFVANHSSPVDPTLIWMNHSLHWPSRKVTVIRFMTAREYCEIPGLVGWICQVMGSIPVDRDGQDMAPARDALRRLQRGDLIGVFPEGRLNEGSDLLPANPGIAWLALKADVPVCPVYVHNAPRGTNMVDSFYTRKRVRVSYGRPIDLAAWRERKPDRQTMAEVTDVIMQHLADLGGVKYTDATESPGGPSPHA